MPDVRPETGADHDAIWHVLERAFAPSIGEAKLVDELRAAGDLVPDFPLVVVLGRPDYYPRFRVRARGRARRPRSVRRAAGGLAGGFYRGDI